MKVNHNIASFKAQIKNITEAAGVYQFYDKTGKIIYIGKAKNLKKRIGSYLNKHHDNAKIRMMVSKIDQIQHIIVESEHDALLLENNLIKKYQPRYNIMLKDDKSYPWICLKKENFPRVFFTRSLIKDGSQYFGPYTSVKMVKAIMDMIKTLYKLRTCNYKLTSENIEKGKFKRCLEYHLGNCKAPCEGLQKEEEYNQSIEEIKHILKGNLTYVLKFMKAEMLKLATNQKYEEAHKVKERITFLNKYQSRSTVVSVTINNVDVFSYFDDKKNAYVNFLKITNGAVVQSHTVELKKKLNESKEELLILAIVEIRQKIPSTAKEIILPFKVDYKLDNAKYVIPLRGEKKQLLDLSKKNAIYYRQEKLKRQQSSKRKEYSKKILEKLQTDLHLNELPVHIECIDNSNIQGANPVAACVVFKNAKPAKNEYRHFNIKSVKGIDDFASMKEIVYRRYKRLIEEKKPLPQLIVIDGGKGQLNAALTSLKKLHLHGQIAIIGIAKRLEEIYFPNDPVPLYLDKNSRSLKIIQQLRNEAHRFGIVFHRQKRSKDFIRSQLTQIKGIGPKTANNLLQHFKSVEGIQKAESIKIVNIIGEAKAKRLADYFQKNAASNDDS